MFCKGRVFKNQPKISKKIDQKSMQIWSEQKNAQKLSQKIHLGWSWRQFGSGLGHSGASFGYFWMHFGRLLGLRCGTWRLLGVILSILGALERVLAAIFGQSRVLKQLFSNFYRFWEVLARFGEGLWLICSMFFRITLEHCDFAKTSKTTEFLQCFVKAKLQIIKNW